MFGLGVVVGVVGLVGEVVIVVDDGSEICRVGENSWVYGIECYDVIS